MPENPKLSLSSMRDAVSKAFPDAARQTTHAVATIARSSLGIALLSVLNIAWIAFFVFHFVFHSDDTVQAGQIDLRPGNLSLEPAPAQILAIPSHIVETDPAAEPPAQETALLIDQPMPEPTSPAMTPEPLPEDDIDLPDDDIDKVEAQPERYWVQLGALSTMTTAQSFWTTLRNKHDDLLGPFHPEFVGPDQAGGRLFHLRVGPLPTELAGNLCSNLKDAGTECFCIADHGGEAGSTSSKAEASWPEPS